MSFFDQINKKNNLLTVAYYDLNVTQFKIGSRALELINTLVTGPLWRRLECEKFVLDMSVHYKNMLVLFEKWASNCILFVKGEESLFSELVHKVDPFNVLVQPNEEIVQDTIQCLELFFGSFVVVSHQMLRDHLKASKYAEPSKELMIEAKSTSTSNVETERDLEMFDRFNNLKMKT